MPAAALPTFRHQEFSTSELVRLKRGTTVSLCLPAHDEVATVGHIVAIAHELVVAGLVDELVVIDDASADGTAEVAEQAGARVVRTTDVLTEHPAPGKGQALWKSLHVTRGDLVVWCDADLTSFGAHFVTGLVGPLLTRPEIHFVKACYQRPLDGEPGEGGRVTELVARPLLALLFPSLASVAQPLGGEYAGRRSVLERVPFATGWGVDLALLIDVARRVGVEAIAQVDLGTRAHVSKSLADLVPQAEVALSTALARAGVSTPGARLPDDLPPMIDVEGYSRRSA